MCKVDNYEKEAVSILPKGHQPVIGAQEQNAVQDTGGGVQKKRSVNQDKLKPVKGVHPAA